MFSANETQEKAKGPKEKQRGERKAAREVKTTVTYKAECVRLSYSFGSDDKLRKHRVRAATLLSCSCTHSAVMVIYVYTYVLFFLTSLSCEAGSRHCTQVPRVS